MNHKNSSIYISEEAKKALLNHKYQGTDESILSEKFQPFWEWCVRQLPVHMAPNLVTLTGFLCILSSFVLVLMHYPTLDGEHSWVMIYTAIALFVYQTFDSIDGKQARRTSSSSPLGELFDHGCDALVTMFQAITTCCAMQFGTTIWSVLFCTSIYLASTFIIWENYYTDVLRFDKYSSPTEALIIAELMYLGIGVFGSNWLKTTIFGYQLNHIFFSVASLVSVKAAWESILQVAKHAPKPKRGNYIGAVSSAAPFVMVIITYLYTFQFINPQYTLIYCINYCLILSYLTTRLVVSRVSNETITPFYLILVPTATIAINHYFKYICFTKLVFFSLVWVIFCYTHFVVVVIDEIKTVLGIRTFKIVPKFPLKDT